MPTELNASELNRCFLLPFISIRKLNLHRVIELISDSDEYFLSLGGV